MQNIRVGNSRVHYVCLKRIYKVQDEEEEADEEAEKADEKADEEEEEEEEQLCAGPRWQLL